MTNAELQAIHDEIWRQIFDRQRQRFEAAKSNDSFYESAVSVNPDQQMEPGGKKEENPVLEL